MKQLLMYSWLILLCSCNEKHMHDGFYKCTVFTNAAMTWVTDEEIQLNGNDMYYKNISVLDHHILQEYKLSCKQFDDHMEYINKEGLNMIVRFTPDGDFRSGDYLYKKFDPQTASVKVVPASQVVNTEPAGDIIALYSNGNSIYAEVLELYKDKSNFEIRDKGQRVFYGTQRADGRFINPDGNESIYKEYKEDLYRIRNGKWVKFENQSCGM